MSQHRIQCNKTPSREEQARVCSYICTQSDCTSKHWGETFAASGRAIKSYLAAEVPTKYLQKTVWELTSISSRRLGEHSDTWDSKLQTQTPVLRRPKSCGSLGQSGSNIMASYRELVSREVRYFSSWFRVDFPSRFWKFLYCLSLHKTAPSNHLGQSWLHPHGKMPCVEILQWRGIKPQGIHSPSHHSLLLLKLLHPS